MLRSLILICLLTVATTTNSSAQIIALGASNTAGYGVGPSAAYPAVLEELLRANGRPMSVSNAGDRKSTRLNSVTWPSRMPSSA